MRIPKLISATALRLLALALPLMMLDASVLLARSWSYHYTPKEPQPSAAVSATPIPETSTRFSNSRLFKQAIISDLALYAQNPANNSGGRGLNEHSQYVISRLLPFDHMSSPEALAVLASLSGYYLGPRGEKVYGCLLLRKGKPIKPYLSQYASTGTIECSRELGPGFEMPSAALGGMALCPSIEEQSRRLANLISEIDLSRSCSDEELQMITQSASPSMNAR